MLTSLAGQKASQVVVQIKGKKAQSLWIWGDYNWKWTLKNTQTLHRLSLGFTSPSMQAHASSGLLFREWRTSASFFFRRLSWLARPPWVRRHWRSRPECGSAPLGWAAIFPFRSRWVSRAPSPPRAPPSALPAALPGFPADPNLFELAPLPLHIPG